MTSINFGDLYKNATTLITGEFDAVIAETEAKESSNGNPMIKIKLQIVGGPHHGRPFWTQQVAAVSSPGAMRMFFGTMGNLGLDGTYFSKNPTLEQIAADMRGKNCRIRIKKGEYRGAEREEVEAILAPTSGAGALPNVPGPSASGSAAPAIPAPSTGGSVPSTPASGGSAVPPPPAF